MSKLGNTYAFKVPQQTQPSSLAQISKDSEEGQMSLFSKSNFLAAMVNVI